MGGDSQNFRTDFENLISRPVKPVKTGKNIKSPSITLLTHKTGNYPTGQARTTHQPP